MAEAVRCGATVVLALSLAEARVVATALADLTNEHEQGNRDFLNPQRRSREYEAAMRIWRTIPRDSRR